jgi:hypothetical protein
MTPISVIVGQFSPDFEIVNYSMREDYKYPIKIFFVTWSESPVMGRSG